ncbi:MAG: hypothetical protein ACR2HH_01825 [Chthoniobacterales bacterium]
MADQSDTFEVNIRTTGDTSGATAVKEAIREVNAEAEAASARAGGLPGQQRGQVSVARAAEVAATQEEVAAEEALAEKKAATLALDERRNGLLQQRQALITSEIEALQLEAAGESEQAAAVTAEIAERRAALQIQQTTNLSEEESLILARQKIAAEAELASLKTKEAAAIAEANAGSLLAGVNIGKARAEATTLTREIATGTVNMRTVSALAGSLGPALGTAAIAGLVTAGIIGEIGKKMDESRITAEKESVEFQKQTEHWRATAAAAKDFADVQKLTEEVAKRVNDINERSRQVASEVGSGFFTTELNGLKLISNFFGTDFKTSTDIAIQEQRDLADQTAATGKVFTDLAQRRAEYVKSLSDLSLTAEIDALKTKIGELVATQETLDRSNTEQANQWKKLQTDVDGFTKILDGVEKKEQAIEKTSARLNAELKKLNFDQLSKPQQLTALAADLESVRKRLHDIGVEAATPAEALALIGSEVSDHTNKVKGLVVEWEKLAEQPKKTAEEEKKLAEQQKKTAEEEKKVSDAIRDQVRALRDKEEALRAEILSSATSSERRREAIKELQDLEKQIGAIGKTQGGFDNAKDAGLEKWLLGIISDANSTTIAIDNARNALLRLYAAQSKAPSKSAIPSDLPPAPPAPTQAGGDTYNYAPPGSGVPAATPYGPPLPGGTAIGGDRSNYIPGPTGDIYVAPIESGSSGQQNAFRQPAKDVSASVSQLGEVVAGGFKEMAKQVQDLHTRVSREIASTKTDIAALQRAS